MTHHRRGNPEESRQWLARATEWYDIETRKALAAPGCRLPADWRYFSQFQVLYAEAQALIEGGEPKDDRNGKALQARARETLKALDRATYDYDLALLLDPDQAGLYLARGRRLAELGRWDQAEADLAKAVSLKPDNAQVWKDCGITHAEFGRAEQAAGDFVKALDSPGGSEPGAGVPGELARWDPVFDRVTGLRPKDKRLWDARLDFLAHAAAGRKLSRLQRTLPIWIRMIRCTGYGTPRSWRRPRTKTGTSKPCWPCWPGSPPPRTPWSRSAPRSVACSCPARSPTSGPCSTWPIAP